MTTQQQLSPAPDRRAETLRGMLDGHVHLPGDRDYDEARLPWNVAVDQRPAAVAFPASSTEVATIVRMAARAGLRVAPQGTGHNAGPLGPLDDVVLVRTSRMRSVSMDPVRGRARVQAGAIWDDVVPAAAAHGLSVLHGSSPDVGVVGYSLGAGIGWYARALGLQTNSITSAEVVTADGTVVRTDHEHAPELFWALRGGGGNFGIVTELEFRTYDFDTAYAGMLVWDWTHARDVLDRWSRWAVDAPDSVTTSFRLLQLPPMPELPEAFRGRQLVVVDGAVLADDDDAERLLAPLRALQPELDTFRRTPTAELVRLHMDPEGPTPEVSDTAILRALPGEAVSRLLEVAGPGSDSSLFVVELRQLGGALTRPAEGAGALPCLDGQFVLFAATLALTPEIGADGLREARDVVAALEPWANGRQYLNFQEAAVDASAGYRAEDWERLLAVRAAVDPDGRFVSNHKVAAAIPEQRHG